MFENVKNGWQVIKASILVFNKYPIFILPLLGVWLLYATSIVYFYYFFDWEKYFFIQELLIIFLIIYSWTLLLTFSCSMLLELIQQLETGKTMNLSGAFKESIGKNLVKIIPLAFIWALIWFILTIIETLLSEAEKNKKEPTPENVAKLVAGAGEVSWLGFSFELLHKGIRMVVFLIMPAFAWEDLDLMNSIKKGFTVLRAHLIEFATGFSLTYLAASIVFLPTAVIFLLSEYAGILFPDWVWYATILYAGLAWSYSMYLEQMFTANLYLWHLKWEKAYDKAKKAGKKLPTMHDVNPPSILDDVPDLLE